MLVAALWPRLEALEERLDAARRRAEPPGQLALDLTGGSSAGKGQGSGGEQCGASWIDPNKTCHKGQGGAPLDPAAAPLNRQAPPLDPPAAPLNPTPSEARRSKPKQTIAFPAPIEGPSGARLTAYTWQWTLTEDVDHRGEPVEKRVSDWEKSIASVETGRNVVHQFQVEAGGETRTVSAESALKLMGYLSDTDRKAFGSLKNSARTVARLRMAQQEVQQRAKRFEDDWQQINQLKQPEIQAGQWQPDPDYAEHDRREWQMGDSHETEMRIRGRRNFSDDEMESQVRGAWLNDQMKGRGWGEGRRWWNFHTERDSLRRNEDDLAKRLARAEAKLMAQARSDSALGVDRFDSLLARLDALKRRCSTGYSCGSACISVKKECRSQPTATTSRERISRLERLAKGQIKPRGIGTPKPEEAQALAGRLRNERTEQQAVIKAERERRKAAANQGGKRKPSVKVLLRRAKPGGEMGPDGHWYAGGAWMSEGSFVGAKTQLTGQGEGRDQQEKPTGDDRQRVVRPKRPSFPERPLKPKGEGLPQPTGLKKVATKNDEQFFGDDGYILYPQPKGAPGLGGSLFTAAVTQRMSTDELQWATEQIKQQAYQSTDAYHKQSFDDSMATVDDDIARYGGPAEFSKGDRWTAERQLIGVDADRYIAGVRFMAVSGLLGSVSPASKRRKQRYRDPRFEDWIVPSRGQNDEWVWGLNNVFRAVARRRKRAEAGSRVDRFDALADRIDAVKRKCATGYSCGSTCISVKKECRSEGGATTSKERIRRLQQLVKGEIKPRGLGVPKAEEARALVEALQSQRSAKAKELKTQRSAGGLIPTAKPFSPELEARIKKGITERTIRTGAVNYGGEELADALLVVARAPGRQGENARKALAFMEEAGILTNVAAEDAIEIERVTGKKIGSDDIPWKDGRKLAKIVQEMGLVSDERLEWYKKDTTSSGRYMVRMAELIRDSSSLKPSPEEQKAKARLADQIKDLEKATADFDRSVQQGWRFEEDRKEVLSYYNTSVKEARRTHNDYKKWRQQDLLNAAQRLITSNTKGLSNNNSGGFYMWGQKAYVARAGDDPKKGERPSFMSSYKAAASETDPARIKTAYSEHLSKYLPEKLDAMDKKGADYYLTAEGALAYKGRMTPAEKTLGVHIHELGHAVDNFAGVILRSIPARYAKSGENETVLMHPIGSDRTRSRPQEVMDLLQQKRAPSAYALTNDMELFAESFASWVFAPEAFERIHPELHDWVESRVGTARQTMSRHGKLAFKEEWG